MHAVEYAIGDEQQRHALRAEQELMATRGKRIYKIMLHVERERWQR
jgi:hypothetical protein